MEEISTGYKLHDEEKPLRCLERSQHVGQEPALRIYQWNILNMLCLFVPALRAHGQNLSFKHADVCAILTQNFLLANRLDRAKLFVRFSFRQDHLRPA